MKHRLWSAIAGVGAAVLALTGCSTASNTASPTTTETSATSTAATSSQTHAFPVTVPYGLNGAKVTIDKKPTAIVSLSPTSTEDLFAIGAGKQVVAADEYSTYPAQAPKTKLSGYTPNVEAILNYHPDLVIVTQDRNNVVAGLEKAGVKVLVYPAATSIDDAYTQIESLGAVTGNVADAASVVANMQSRIKAAVAKVGDKVKGMTYYHEVDSTLYSITSNTFLGKIYSLFGLKNIVPNGPTDYPQLTNEAIIAANPQLMFLGAAHPSEAVVNKVKERPGWGTIPAVKDGHIFVLNNDISSRWGPRIADLVESIANQLATIKTPAHAS